VVLSIPEIILARSGAASPHSNIGAMP